MSAGKAVAAPLSQLTTEIRSLVNKVAENVMAIGSRLRQVKDFLAEHPEHGTFHEWLNKEFDGSIWTAHNLMRVYISFKPHAEKISQLSPSVLYLLSGPSVAEETRQEVLGRFAAGEEITHSKVKALLEERKSIEDSLRGLTEEEKLELLRNAEEAEDDGDNEDAPEPKTALEKYQATWTKQAKYDQQFLSSPKIARQAEKLRAKYESHVKYDLGK
jgi:hypothetical protein